jgi:hypothetical protein
MLTISLHKLLFVYFVQPDLVPATFLAWMEANGGISSIYVSAM